MILKVAFSMNVDSINDPNNVFNKQIFETLDGLQDALQDRIMKYKLNKRGKIAKYRKLVRTLRDVGRQQILNRIEAIKNGEVLPDDILTAILKNYGMKMCSSLKKNCHS